jgi:hypothetical protein
MADGPPACSWILENAIIKLAVALSKFGFQAVTAKAAPEDVRPPRSRQPLHPTTTARMRPNKGRASVREGEA